LRFEVDASTARGVASQTASLAVAPRVNPSTRLRCAMNILLAIPFPITEIGGVTTFVTRLQDGLNERGHNALLLVPGDADQVAPCDGCGRSNVYSAFLRPWYVRGAVLKGLVAFFGYLPLTLFDLWTFLRRQRIDVVHVHFPTPSYLYFALLRPISRWKLMISVHGSDIYALSRR